MDINESLPTGTVALLLADVQGSTRLWETQPEQMAAAVAQLGCHARGRGGSPPRGTPARTRRRAIRSSSHSPAPPMPPPARWRCNKCLYHRSGCGSGFMSARSSCVTTSTTSGRPSTAPPGCAIWRTAGKRCCPEPRRTSSPTHCRRGHGWSTSARTRCVTCPAPERVAQLCHADVDNEFPPLRVTTPVDSHTPSITADQLCRPATDRLTTLGGLLGGQSTGHRSPARAASARPGSRSQVAARVDGVVGVVEIWPRSPIPALAADHRRAGPQPARSTGPSDDRHCHAVHRRPAHAPRARQLRTPVGRHACRWSTRC